MGIFKKDALLNTLLLVIPMLVIVILSKNLLSQKGEKVEITQAQIELEIIRTALVKFGKDTGRYPMQEEGLSVLISGSGITGWKGPYINKEKIRDPWGNKYIYVNISHLIFIGSSGLNGKWETTENKVSERDGKGDDIVVFIKK